MLFIDLRPGGPVRLLNCLIIQTGMSFFMLRSISPHQQSTCHSCCPRFKRTSTCSLIRSRVRRGEERGGEKIRNERIGEGRREEVLSRRDERRGEERRGDEKGGDERS